MTTKFKRPREHPFVTADIVVFTIKDGVLSVLIIPRTNDPDIGMKALPGGFLQHNESSVEAAIRILKDKTGVTNVFLEQLYTFDEPKRDPRGRIIAITYIALVPEHKLDSLVGGAEVKPVDLLDKMAFDHKHILEYAVSRLRSKLEYTNAAYSLLPRKFTLSELQALYEVILDQKIDKRNFRKKILSLDMLEATDERLTGKKHRPARLYKFKKQSTQNFETPFVWN